MKKKDNGSSIVFAEGLPHRHEINSLSKKNKSRLLPDVFYLRWEFELLAALVAIIVLLVLPDWLNRQVNMFLSRYNVSMNTGWVSFACNVLLLWFSIYIIVRVCWLYFVSKKVDVSEKKLHLVRTTDQLAEYIFSVCLIILMGVILISATQFLGIFLKGIVSGRMNNATGVNQ
jgi:hypothetical protein